MHELGVVFHCIEEVNQIAKDNNVKRVNSVTVQIGTVSTVIPELFEDCWNWAVKKETVLKDAKVHIEKIHAITHCENCLKDYNTIIYGKECPYCHSNNTYLLQGNEIIIKNIEAIDEVEETKGKDMDNKELKKEDLEKVSGGTIVTDISQLAWKYDLGRSVQIVSDDNSWEKYDGTVTKLGYIELFGLYSIYYYVSCGNSNFDGWYCEDDVAAQYSNNARRINKENSTKVVVTKE